MPRDLRGAVVVITGASSGIGRAAALAFAGRGAQLVLAARRLDALQRLGWECERLGARGIVVPADTTDEAAVQALAQRALQSFGRIDVWLNNAGVTLFARFGEEPAADFRRVLETNILGYVHGARAALPAFRRQRSGVLINVASVAGAVTQPYTSAYTMSKYAVRALGGSLRQELLLAGERDIHVVTVLPQAADTPIFQHAANYTGRAPKALPPVLDAERVAAAIVGAAERPRREVFVGFGGRAFNTFSALAPGLAEQWMALQVDQMHLSRHRQAPPTSGNLHRPMAEGTGVSGGHKPAARGALAQPLIGLALAALPAALAWRRSRRGA